MRVISWFSCGAASAVATKIAIQKYPYMEIVRCWIAEEHPDNERFAADCEKWFGKQIITLQNDKYAGSIYNVFTQRKYISGIGGAPCTYELKKRVREQYQKPTDVHVLLNAAERRSG